MEYITWGVYLKPCVYYVKGSKVLGLRHCARRWPLDFRIILSPVSIINSTVDLELFKHRYKLGTYLIYAQVLDVILKFSLCELCMEPFIGG